jgi:hypothetical protein
MFLFRSLRTANNLLTVGILIFAATNALAASAPIPVSQLALYQGADRETILVQGAKKEGQVVFYNSHTWFKAVAQEFEKKYPFIKVAEWRAEGADVMKRAIEESQAGRFLAPERSIGQETFPTQRHVSFAVTILNRFANGSKHDNRI